MSYLALDDLKACLKPNQRIAGIDLGDRTMGIALSDTRCKIASPLETWKRKSIREDLKFLTSLISNHNLGALVFGMPYHMNGSEGERCRVTRDFILKLHQINPIPVVLWDERLTTQSAIMRFKEGGLSFKKRDKLVDKVAATFILQGVLDYIHQI